MVDVKEGFIKSALQKAHLPIHPHEIIGHLYQFLCQWGSQCQILFGTVNAIMISEHGDVDLYVFPRRWSVLALRSSV